jgi:hypothetical protein
MRQILSIIVVSLLLNGNAYSNDIYSQENRKKSEIKINCKINWIMKFANQDGLHASKYDTSDLPKMINDPKLPGFIVETNLNSRPVWINRVAVKADENWREELSIIRFEQANEKDFVVVRKYNIDYTTKGTKGEDYSFSIDTSIHLHKSDFKGKNTPFNILEADIEDIDLNLERIKKFFNPTSTSFGGCNKIDPNNFDFEETVVQNEIRIAEYEAKKEKELLNKKKEKLKKARIVEGKFELNCKDGAFVNPSTGEVISTFTSEINYLLNVSDYTYQNLNSKNNKNYQFMNGGDFYPDQLIFYRLDSTTVQFASYNKKTGELTFVTHTNLEELSKYNEIKSQFDEINKRSPNYKPEIGFDGEENYNVSTELGNKEYNENSNPSSVEFLEFAKLGILVNYLKIFDLKVAKYECNKIQDLN